MNKIEQVSRVIQHAVVLIDLSRREKNLPKSGPMSYSQLEQFDHVLKELQKKIEDIRHHKALNNYQPWIARVIADSWPVNDLGEQIMKAEREYMELQNSI